MNDRKLYDIEDLGSDDYALDGDEIRKIDELLLPVILISN
jgi:hypothetical protein